jgi:hypothetical protein
MINSKQTAAAQDAAELTHTAALVTLRHAERALRATKPFTIAKGRAIEGLDGAQQAVAAAWNAYCHARANHDEMVNYERQFGAVA